MSGEQNPRGLPPPVTPGPKILQETRYPSQLPPAAKPKEMPPEIRALKEAQSAMQAREGEQGEWKSRMQAAMGNSTNFFAGTESLFSDTEKQRMRGGGGTPEQVFQATFQKSYERLTGQDANMLPTKDLAQRIIGAWHRGDESTIKQDLGYMKSRMTTAGKVSSPRTKRAVEEVERNDFAALTGRVNLADVFGVNPAKYNLTEEQFLRGILSPQAVQEMVERLDAGEDPEMWAAQARAKRDIGAMERVRQQTMGVG